MLCRVGRSVNWRDGSVGKACAVHSVRLRVQISESHGKLDEEARLKHKWGSGKMGGGKAIPQQLAYQLACCTR